MKLSKIKLNNSGLTFVEVVVVVAIIVIVTSITFLGRGAIDNGQKVKMTAQKLASDIRKMQSYVLNLQDHNGVFPDGGWGVFIDNRLGKEGHYVLFADINDGDFVYDDISEIYLDVELPNGIVFSSWRGERISNPGTMVDIPSDSNINLSFQPPDPTVSLCKHNPNGCINPHKYNIVELTLSNSDGSVKKIVEINKYGLIDVQNE